MRTPFTSPYRITQRFGERPEYYKQFNLKGHEGLDLVPTGSNWDILALEDGIVVKDEDSPRSGAYGVYLTVWHPSFKRATQYCHLKENYVKLGDQVTKGQKIGTMGSTGNSTGAHLHLNLYETDDKGIRQNRTNGYNGGTDPLPFLQQVPQTVITQKIVDDLRTERDNNWNLYQDTLSELEGIKSEKRVYEEFRNAISEKLGCENQLPVITGKIETLITIEDQKNSLQTEYQLLKKDKEDLENELKVIEPQVNERKDLLEANKRLTEANETLQKALDSCAYDLAITQEQKNEDRFTTKELFRLLIKRLAGR